MKLKKDEFVVTAYAESASGPGWANSPIWVIVRNADGVMRQEYLQPDEQTPTMRTLYQVSQNIHMVMTKAVESLMRKS